MPLSTDRDLRNHQLFFGAFTAIFGGASLLYAFFPATIAAQFAQMDAQLGGSGAGYPEPQCRIWIALAAANVATLSLMCFMLVKDLRRFAAVRWPLLFMKCVSALLFVTGWLALPGSRSLLAAALGDFATGWGIWHFSQRAIAKL
jgi:hypothetical protein